MSTVSMVFIQPTCINVQYTLNVLLIMFADIMQHLAKPSANLPLP